MKTVYEILDKYNHYENRNNIAISLVQRPDAINAMKEYAKEIAQEAYKFGHLNTEVYGDSNCHGVLEKTFDKWWEETFPQDKQ